jgi:hypothetical protein
MSFRIGNDLFRGETYDKPLVAEGQSVSYITKTSKNIFKLLISVFSDCRRKLVGIFMQLAKHTKNSRRRVN